MLSTPHTEGAHITNDKKLPWPYPPRRHPPLMELSFATLGWINRAAQAVGSDRFVETVHRARFNLDAAAAYAVTPAEIAVLEGLSATLEAVIQADSEARALLDEAVSELAEAFTAEVLETDVVQGRAYLKGRDTTSDPTQVDPESKGMRREK